MCPCMSFIYVIYVLILYMPILFCCFTCGGLIRDDLIKKYKQANIGADTKYNFFQNDISNSFSWKEIY